VEKAHEYIRQLASCLAVGTKALTLHHGDSSSFNPITSQSSSTCKLRV